MIFTWLNYFFFSNSNAFLIFILWSFKTFLMNSNSTISFCHYWFIIISQISVVIDIKFHLLAVIYDDLTFNYCMILSISWRINHVIIVNSEDCYSLCDAILCGFRFAKRQQITEREEMWWKNHLCCIQFSKSHMCDYSNSFFLFCM